MKKGWNIPNHWEMVKLQHICERITQGPNPKYDKSGTSSFRVLKTKDLYDTEIRYSSADTVSESVFQLHLKAELFPGDLLLAIVGQGSINKCNVFEGPRGVRFIFTRALGLIRPNKDIVEPHFLKYFLQSDAGKSMIDAGVGGTSGQQVVTTTHLKGLQIPIPPLEEQRRIVAVLDEAFAAITTATANAEKNLANARELFQGYLDHQVEQCACNDNLTRLENICEVRDGTHYSPKYVEVGIPFVTQKNIRNEGLNFAGAKSISEDDHLSFYKRSNVAYGDIIISMIGANRGMACIVDDKRTFSIKNVGLIKSNDRASMSFLLYFLKSSRAKDYVKSASNGGAQEFIGLKKLRDFPVPDLTLDRQQQIAHSLDLMKIQSAHLERNFHEKLAILEDLKQSLLHRAFTGELTTANSELIPS